MSIDVDIRFPYIAIGCILAALGLVASLPAGAGTVHRLSASSTGRVEVTPDGKVIMQVRNARLVPYVLFDGENHPRLATITSDVRSRTDAEGLDPKSTVSFTVEDLSGAAPKRLSSFSDPGAEGEVLGERYGVATMPGCCGGADLHRVRALETGRALFRSTGDGPVGSSAWAEAPNAKPRTVRWAAFDGEVSEKESAAGLLGRIVYGGDAGPLSSVELRTASRNDDLSLGLSHAAVLVWIDPKASPANGAPGSGTPASPQDIWQIEGISDPARLGGFGLALMLDGKRLAAIPIEHDRLVAAKAQAAKALTVRGGG